MTAPRRIALVAGLSILALLGLVAIGASQRPSVSRIVYPRNAPTVDGVNHAHPGHRMLRCVRCHERAEESTRATDDLRPTAASCAPCHAAGSVHVGPRAQARLSFSHAAHVGEGIRCVACHDGWSDPAAVVHMPSMQSCLGCHNEEASIDCGYCHVRRPDGLVQTRFEEGWLNPPRWLGGLHHDEDFIVRHRWVAADLGSVCASCHAESDCTDCHDGRLRPPRVHPNDWLTIHPEMARRDEPRCTSCHTLQSFCSECHARVGISQIAAPLVRASERFHPPASVWISGPVEHAREARLSMTACVSCHVERDCVGCHGSSLIGGAGLSPHGPGFLAESCDALERNGRACALCHGDLGSIADRCR